MEILTIYGLTTAASFAYMTIVWGLSLLRRNASLVDSFWGPGFVLLASVAIAASGNTSQRSLVALSLATAWGVRLCAYVTLRNGRRGEDWRYKRWRAEDGAAFWWKSLFRVFVLQAALLVIVASPLILVCARRGPERLTAFDAAGVAVWGVGFLFEVVGDAQLRRFKRDPSHKGQVMDRGLWRYTRHPNYFGETVLWWGVFLLALSVPYGYATVWGPITITFLLLRVSGVRMLEKGLKQTKPDYAAYVARTSAFLPRRPRRPRPS